MSNTIKLRMVAGLQLALAAGTVKRDECFLVNMSDKDKFLSRVTVERGQTVKLFQIETGPQRAVLDLSTNDLAAQQNAPQGGNTSSTSDDGQDGTPTAPTDPTEPTAPTEAAPAPAPAAKQATQRTARTATKATK